MFKYAILVAALGILGCEEQVEKDKATRHCVDKNKKVVDESLCESKVSSGSSGSNNDFMWWYLMYHATTGSQVNGGYAQPPSQGFVPHTQKYTPPSHAYTPHPSTPAPVPAMTHHVASKPVPWSLPKSSAPIRTHSTPSYSAPSYSKPSHGPSYSSPSYSRPSSGSSIGRSSARSR